MTDIVVVRGTGTRPGPDIQDPLLASAAAAVARGRAAIDAATPASIVNLECKYRSDVRVGDLVEVRDQAQGAAYRAQVVAMTLFQDAQERIGMRIRLWRPQDA